MAKAVRNCVVLTVVACVFVMSAQAADLLGVRFGPNGDKTRIVFDLSGNLAYTVSGDAMNNGRLLIDFADLTVNAADRDFRPGNGHISRYGFADGPGANLRAVFELKKNGQNQRGIHDCPSWWGDEI